jgi:hypothetical protein
VPRRGGFDIDLSFRTDNTNPTTRDDYGGIAAPDRFAKSAARKLVKGRVVKTCYYMADSLWVNVRGFSGNGPFASGRPNSSATPARTWRAGRAMAALS